MKKLFCLALILISVSGKLCAQEKECANCPPVYKNKTDATFNYRFITNRFIVHLKKRNAMIVEPYDVRDQDVLSNMDSLLTALRNDLAPFKDSLQTAPGGNLRIDYSVILGMENKKIRIQKYTADGDTYLDQKGTISKLKIEQDTIHLLMYKVKEKKYGKAYDPVQLTLLLNNYADIDSLVAHSAEIQHYIDTVFTVNRLKYKRNNPYLDRTSIVYDPYATGKQHFRLMKGAVIKSENDVVPNRPAFAMNAYLGAGLVRNMLSPTGDLGIEYRIRGDRYASEQTLAGIYVSPYFLFDKKPDGTYGMHDNWFVNAEVGATTKDDPKYIRGTLGVGYLVHPDGINFQKTTMKAFFNYTFKNAISVSPEIIATDNFHTIFPGFTVKYYLNVFLD